MNKGKNIKRTLYEEFEEIDKEQPDRTDPSPKFKNPKTGRKFTKVSEDETEEKQGITRDYETRTRTRKSHRSDRQGNNRSVMKPRQENSLGELTKKFIQLIKQTEDYCIDLNEAVEELGVQK